MFEQIIIGVVVSLIMVSPVFAIVGILDPNFFGGNR